MKKLLWRLKNGEVPLKREPKVAVVLIGTEDLVSPACADPITAPRTAAELRGLLVYMHRCWPMRSVQCFQPAHAPSPRGQPCTAVPCCVTALDQLPLSFRAVVQRRDRALTACLLLHGRRMPAAQIVAMGVLPKGQTWPNRCTDAITEANQRLQEYADRHKPWLSYVDVGDRFLTHQVCTAPSHTAARMLCHAYLAGYSITFRHVRHMPARIRPASYSSCKASSQGA